MRNLLLSLTLITLLIVTLSSAKHNVTQVANGKVFNESLTNTQFTLLYIYSSSCQYCQQFTPLYEKLSALSFYQQKNVQFIKVDAQLFKPQTQKFAVYSYPTLLLFWRGYEGHPIKFNEQRTQPNIKQFVQQNTKITQIKLPNAAQMSVYQRVEQKVVILYSNKGSELYMKMGLLSKRDQFFSWTTVDIEQPSQERIQIGNKQLTGGRLTLNQIEQTIQRVFARVHSLGEQPWMRIFSKKQLGIAYINTEQNRLVSKLLTAMSEHYPQLVFMQIHPSHPQYKHALKAFTMNDQQNVIAVDRRMQAVFVANQPYTNATLTDFIQKVLKYQWPIHRKSQKSTREEKLTRENYNQKLATKQDVVLFLYRRQEQVSRALVDLFNHLRNKLSGNGNLLFLRCDVSSNQIEEYLGFALEKTPKIVFFRNRMKDRPIHFYQSKISEKSVIEFIMENTTFDWKDQWAEL